MRCSSISLLFISILIIVNINQPLQAQTLEQRIQSLVANMTLAEKVKQLHREGGMNTADNIRLSIPGILMADGPHGVREGMATSWPVGIGMAATWDVELAERVGYAMGEEFRGKGKHQALGPCLDITLDPRNGRTPESGGEDPYLNAQINVAAVRGIQNAGVIATIKHYYTEFRQQNRKDNNYLLTNRMLMEYHGLPFRETVQLGGALSVMSAYNLVNSEQASESDFLLNEILRARWGFPFYVVSDWDAIKNAEMGINGGCDVCMGSDHYENVSNGLLALANAGQISVATIDKAVQNVLRCKYLYGMMDMIPAGDPADVNSPEHQAFCLEAGKKSIVLLKNENNILPLDKNSQLKVALIGPSAATLPVDGSGSAYVTPFYTVTVKQALEKQLGADNVLYARGCDISGSTFASDFINAVNYAREADVVIYVGGLDGSQEGEGFDRANGSIELPGKQKDLIETLHNVNDKVIVVLISGGICSVHRFLPKIEGLIQAFYPGQEGGNAIAAILFGDYNPAGRLPVTLPQSDGQLPEKMSGNLRNFGSEFHYGYRWFDDKGFTPEFAFGYGLSYTTFTYNDLAISSKEILAGEKVVVTARVTNTGDLAGEEVSQLYLSGDGIYSSRYHKELKGFQRIFLNPGESKTVVFTLTPDQLYRFNETAMNYEVEEGNYTVFVGGSSDNLPLHEMITVRAAPGRPDLQIASLYTWPRYPQPGEHVVFLATIINRGTAASPAGQSPDVRFSMDGIPICAAAAGQTSIPAGGMRLVFAESGIQSAGYWEAGNPGDYTLHAEVNYSGAMEELDRNNNSMAKRLTVYPEPPENLAKGKAVTASSAESSALSGGNAADGNYSTRWSSQFSDPQWIKIDFGASISFNQIRINWETAYASVYKVEISDDNVHWTLLLQQNNGTGGIEKFAVAASARWLRLTGLKRATEWGYSIFEVEVFNTPSGVEDKNQKTPGAYHLSHNYPNPFNATTMIKYQLPKQELVQIRIYDILGREVVLLVNEIKAAGWHQISINAGSYDSGVYFCRMETINYSQVIKMTLVK